MNSESMKPRLLLFGFLLSTAILLPCRNLHAAESRPPEDLTFFREQVHPILKAHCLKCHGGEKIKGGLVLTSRENLMKGGESGAAFDPEAPVKSRILEMMSYRDSEHEMPPAGKRPQAELDILQKWLSMGAPYDPTLETKAAPTTAAAPAAEDRADWWSYKPVQNTTPPRVSEAAWAVNPVDAFLQNGLQKAGLRHNLPASKAQLIRRAYYDLIGLPPTPEEVRLFVEDASPEAWPRLIDTLLSKPQYGEKWARHWMDVIRYAESEGFERDNEKQHIWRYRDYLIEAFNADLPYDRFIIEQLAGDELENRTQQTLTATGFLRLMQSDDEPADRLLAKYDALADNVQMTSEAFMGMTMGCARCHDHKKDPISQRDYYSFMSFFHGMREYRSTVNSPLLWATDEQKKQLDQEQLQTLKRNEDEYHRIKEALSQWQSEYAPTAPTPAEDTRLVQPVGGPENAWLHTVKAPTSNWRVESFDATSWAASPSTPAKAGDLIWMRSKFGLAEIPKEVSLDIEYSGLIEVFINGSQLIRAHNLPKGTRSLQIPEPVKKQLHTGANFIAIRMTVLEDGILPKVSLSKGRTHLEHIESLIRAAKPDAKKAAAQILDGDQAAKLKRINADWLAEANRPTGIPLSIVSENGATPEPLSIHRRGSPQNLGDPVEPAFPVVLSTRPGSQTPTISPLQNTSSGRRMALARWLTQPENPLVSRVAVNRIWQHHFGRGLVPTPNDFGRLGEMPTHPELLDYLASTFIQNGWSMKAMHRLLMTSQAYQMSSAASPDSIAKDPENQHYWRYPMRRLTAEELRDSILSVTGTLRLDRFGPPVHPPLPRAVLETQSSPGRGWPEESEEHAARRSIYVHVKRSLSVPLLSDHDQAPTDTPCAVRFVSTVPTQALGMLNSEFMEAQARHFAKRIRKEAGPEPLSQIRHGLRLVFQRPPSEQETTTCRQMLARLQAEPGVSEEKALERFALLALNLNEFIYLD